MTVPGALEFLAWGVGGVLATAIVVGLVRRGHESRRLTIADRITVTRLALVTPTTWLLIRHHVTAALLCYLVLVVTDVVDGIVARGRREASSFGTFLDPLADILSTFAVFTVFVIDGLVPRWLYLLLLVRYVPLTVASVILTRRYGPVDFRSTLPGKIVGVVQAAVALWIMYWASRGVRNAPGDGPLFAFLAVGFVSIVVSQALIGYRHVRRAHRRARG